jgi:hypothetical protein
MFSRFPVTFQFRKREEAAMHPRKRLAAPAKATVYCQFVGFPHGCIAPAGVVLRPWPVARAAVRHNAGGN